MSEPNFGDLGLSFDDDFDDDAAGVGVASTQIFPPKRARSAGTDQKFMHDPGHRGVPQMSTPPAVSPDGAILDLAAWMRQWRYTPELDYVKLERVAPAQYHGIGATGHLEDLYAAENETYVRNTWGGGTFRVHAFQQRGGTPYPVSSGYFNLAGHPAAFPGSDGLPVPYPVGGPGQGAMYESAGRRAQANMAPQAPALPGNGQPFDPNHGLAQLVGRLQQGQENRGNAEVLDKFHKQAETASKTQLETMREALDKTDTLHQRMLDMRGASEAPLRDALQAAQAQLEAVRNEYSRRFDAMRSEHSEQLGRIQETNMAAVTMLQKEHESATKALQETNSNTIQQMRDSSAQTSQQIRDHHSAEMAAIRRDLDNARDQAAQRERDIREAHQKTLDDLRARAEERIRAADAAISEARSERHRDVDAIREDSRRRETDLRSDFEKRLGQMRSDMTSQHGSARDTMTATYVAQIDALKQQLADNRVREDDRVKHERRSAETMYQPRIDMMNVELARIRQDADNAKAEAANANARANQRLDPLQNIQQVAQLTGALNTLSGRGDGGAVPAAPQGWFGQMTAAIPVLSEHLVKPIIAPISDAVKAAREDGEQRRELLNRRMAEHTTQQPQPDVQRRRIVHPPAPLPPPAQGPMPAAALFDNYGQPLKPPKTEQPAHDSGSADVAPTEAVPDGASALLNADVLRHLNNAIDEGKDPNSVAAELQFGVSAGAIPAGVLDTIMTLSSDEVVNRFMIAAQEHGAPSVTTPGGQVFLRGVHAAIVSGT